MTRKSPRPDGRGLRDDAWRARPAPGPGARRSPAPARDSGPVRRIAARDDDVAVKVLQDIFALLNGVPGSQHLVLSGEFGVGKRFEYSILHGWRLVPDDDNNAFGLQ